ncbi:MAG: fructose-1,6-bisphosphatase [Atopobiaceae bacterium]|nr:fructose-1,6-bisphosphatase [Olsenella sp.]MDY3901395.1 fructose-1,6-bisphosphatase [Atopobiaceae bacterium]
MSFRSEGDLKYLRLLAEKFPTRQSVFTEIINLQAILNLPKATEHFMSDVHGEDEAFNHILNNCSGVIRDRVRATYDGELTDAEQAELCTLIYYPKQKLARIRAQRRDTPEWYETTLHRMVRIARYLSNSYTRSKVRKAMPVEYAYIIEELLHEAGIRNLSRHEYHRRILTSIVETGSAEDFFISLASLIKRLAVDRLHLVGDVFDRGPHADRILDGLMAHPSVDVQWGNHDILWMGAAAGSAACVATAVRNNVRYDSYSILESSYGIPLRKLALFAEHTYAAGSEGGGRTPEERAISVILLKLEGQLIRRHPEFDMADRLLLDKVDLSRGCVRIDGVDYELSTRDLPTIDPDDPYALTREEEAVIDDLVASFRSSQKLQDHVNFLFEKGSIYLVRNDNLIFHGCVPMNEDGTLHMVDCGSRRLSGRAYFDFCDQVARRAWREGDQDALDWMWYLWCGRNSPLSGRVVKTFERALVKDRSTWQEPRDAYWTLTQDERACREILREFGVSPERGHIINGHTPVKVSSGESAIRGGGRLLVIDGGFCKAYHAATGIAGFTLVSDQNAMTLRSHAPFESVEAALDDDADIESETTVVQTYDRPQLVSDSDTGAEVREQIEDLKALLEAYDTGVSLRR